MSGRRKHVPTPAEMNMTNHEVMLLVSQLLGERRTVHALRSDVTCLAKTVELMAHKLNEHASRFDALLIAFIRFQGMVGIELPATVQADSRRMARMPEQVASPPRPPSPVLKLFDGEDPKDPIVDF